MGRKLKGGHQAQANAVAGRTNSTRRQVRPLATILDDAEMVLHAISLPLQTLTAVDDEVRRCSGDRPVLYQSETTWQLLNDSWARCLLALASWARGAVTAGGLIDELRDHRTAFTRTAPPSLSTPGADGMRRKHWARSFRLVFPRAIGEFPHVADFAFLRERVTARLSLVRRERNKIAHMYDRRTNEGAALELDALQGRFTYLFRLLAALRLVGLDSQLRLHGSHDSETVTRDLVDRLLLGSLFNVARTTRRWRQHREEVYALLRETDHGDGPFNAHVWKTVAPWLKARDADLLVAQSETASSSSEEGLEVGVSCHLQSEADER